MDWFRWHHGSVNDPKFQLVARKAKASVAEVIAVWAVVLESASASADRGNAGAIDAEAIDCALGMDDGRTTAILAAMRDRSLIDADGEVCNWDKRQPKRERDDPESTDRVRRYRERQRQAEQGNASADDETPSNASETPRNANVTLEERRGDKTPHSPQGGGEGDSDPEEPGGASAGVADRPRKRRRAADGEPPGFAEWYAGYPRHEARKDAAKAFAAIDPDEALQARMQAAVAMQRQSEQWRKEGGRFIPLPATWLRAGRWEDEPIGGGSSEATTPDWLRTAV